MGAGACFGRRSFTGWQLLNPVGLSVRDTSLVGLDIHDMRITGSISLVGGLVAEDLGTVHESSLGVLAAVDEVGVVESELNSTVHNVIRSFDTKHERMLF